MKELTGSEEPYDLQVEAPPGLMPDLSQWGLEEVERGVVEDTAENRKTIRENKGTFTTVFDYNGMPTPYIQVISSEMYQAAQAQSKTAILSDPEDFDSDYLTGYQLLLARDVMNVTPAWVINTTKTFYRQEEEKRALGADAELYQSRLVATPSRCTYLKGDGTRCWGWSNGTSESLSLCRVHVRRANRSKNTYGGMSANQITRHRIQSAAPTIAEALEHLALTAESESVRFSAMKDLLDRAGYKAAEVVEQKVEIEVVDAKTTIQERLAKLQQGHIEKNKVLRQIKEQQEETPGNEPVDAEVVEDDDE